MSMSQPSVFSAALGSATSGAALVATSASDFAAAATASSSPAADPEETCVQPDCFTAIAFNPRTGAWGATKNFPTRNQARDEALQLCRSVGERPRQCEVLGAAKGERCIGAAMRVRDGEILSHTVARADRQRAAWEKAVEELPGRDEFRHRVTAICNG
jgi:hypothetical protein